MNEHQHILNLMGTLEVRIAQIKFRTMSKECKKLDSEERRIGNQGFIFVLTSS